MKCRASVITQLGSGPGGLDGPDKLISIHEVDVVREEEFGYF